MGRYLADIVMRSTGSNVRSMVPMMSVRTLFDQGPISETAGELNSQDQVRQNTPRQEYRSPEHPIEPERKITSGVTEAKNPVVSVHQDERSYITKHIERIEYVQDSGHEKEPSYELGGTRVEKPGQERTAERLSTEHIAREGPFKYKPGSETRPDNRRQYDRQDESKSISPEEKEDNGRQPIERRQELNPSVNDERLNTIKILPGNVSTRLIYPKPPLMENTKPVVRRMTRDAPKLVIGKVVVEIVPPEAPGPTRNTTRVIQHTQETGHTKSNKLSFGLGQL